MKSSSDKWGAKLPHAAGAGELARQQPTGGQSERDVIYARAQPKSAQVTERYYYEQKISRNPFCRRHEHKRPTGHIELTIPYDGHKYFTRQARADVATTIGPRIIDPDTYALIGHLLLTNYTETNLGERLDLNDRYGSIPVRVPVTTSTRSGNLDHLTADRCTCVVGHDYAPHPDHPRITPLDVRLELLDPDSVDLPHVDFMTEEGRKRMNDVALKLTQQVSFRPYLLLRMGVSVNIPRRRTPKDLKPQIKQVAIKWPTITSFSALNLRVDDDEVVVRYNPLTKSLEWSEIEMTAAEDPDDSDIRTYESPEMFLSIRQPGELLYNPENLDATVEVEIPGYLLSGVQARLYSAVGTLLPDMQAELTTHVTSEVQFTLDDAFERRILSPYQDLYFDEVILDDMRVADITIALRDQGFEVRNLGKTSAGTQEGHFLLARRLEGPNQMELWLFVAGRHYTTERHNLMPGGHTYKSTFESGDIRLFIRGELRRDRGELIHEMNALQQALRERFERLRIKR
jgi:hypothetical protein